MGARKNIYIAGCGGMLGEASYTLIPDWWMVLFPGVFITVAVLAFSHRETRRPKWAPEVR